MQIIAAVLRDQGQPFALEPLELDDPRDHEVLVRLVGSGMCHTDLLAREAGPGHFGGPIVLGHEGAGVVEAVGADIDDAAVGDHVVLSFPGDVRLDFRSLISGRRIMGVIEGDAVPCEFIPHLLDLHRQGRFPYDELITAFPFDQINEAAQASANGEVVKPVLVF